MKYADLHMHTNHSDGVCEIKDVLKDAKAHGLEVISITDHDTINHYDEIFKETDDLLRNAGRSRSGGAGRCPGKLAGV